MNNNSLYRSVWAAAYVASLERQRRLSQDVAVPGVAEADADECVERLRERWRVKGATRLCKELAND